jgi:hypothetical protein
MRTIAITRAASSDLIDAGIVCHDLRNPAQRGQ